MPMNIAAAMGRKCKGQALLADEVTSLLAAYLDGRVSDDEVATLFGAIAQHGLNQDKLGGGRHQCGQAIHHDVGVDQLLKPGEPCRAGDVLARVLGMTHSSTDLAAETVRDDYAIVDAPFNDEPPRMEWIASPGPPSRG